MGGKTTGCGGHWKIIQEWLGDSYSDKAVLLLGNKSDLKNALSLDSVINEMKLKVSKNLSPSNAGFCGFIMMTIL